MKIFRIICLIGWGCLTALSLQAQKKVPQGFQYAAEASEEGKLKELTQVSYSGTSSIRLYFEEVQLGENSYLLLEGADGAEQKLNAEALKNWSNSSAYFNGQSVKVSLYQAAGEEVKVKLKELKVNERPTNPKANAMTTAATAQARTQVNQDMPPWAAAVGRFTDGAEAGRTGWIAANGAIVTDVGYAKRDTPVLTSGLGESDIHRHDIIEFNVPPSNPDGSVNHPAPEDQYPINANYYRWRKIQGKAKPGAVFWPDNQDIKFIKIKPLVGSRKALTLGGYIIIEALPNSTGKRPGERIGEYFQVLRHNSGWVMEEMEMEMYHYGRRPFETSISNYALKANKVILKNPNDWLTRVDDKDRFLVYDTESEIMRYWDENSEGGVIVFPNSNVAIGIHSELPREGDAHYPSFGTGFRDQDFRKHLGEFFTTAVTYVDQESVASYDGGNGNIYKPYLTVAEGVQQAADNDILNIARGTYNESVTINKPLKLSAPVGAVVIGAAGGANSRTMRPNIPAALYGDDPSVAFAEEEDLLVEQSSLKSFPNPFTERTELHYSLTDESPVVVKVYDMLGQEVQTLVQEVQPEGEHSIQWDGRNQQGKSAPTGLYILQLKTGEETSTVRVMKQ